MKTTFFTILASAAVVFASPLPEAEADAVAGMPYQPQLDSYPPSGGHGGYSHDPSYDPSYDAPPSYYLPPPAPGGGGIQGQGQFQGQFQFQSQGQWQSYAPHGYAPPTVFGYDSWPEPGDFPSGSLFNNGGGIQQIGNTCAQSQQVAGCCQGGDSSGILGGILQSGCTVNLLASQCSQKLACCDHATNTQTGLVNIGQCSSLLDL